MSYQEHRQSMGAMRVRCAVITLSDTRTEATDKSGGRMREMLLEAGHEVVRYEVIPDDSARLEEVLRELVDGAEVELILTTGGTGISRRDNTIPVVRRHLTMELPGFGELFRMLSYEQIQSGAMLSRALGGIAKGKVLFALPGSTAAVELAMSRLILPEIGHLMGELRK
ncbi:MAG TPA: MogA/MoaB family molybdenum cofactor biosynthesis protein [Tepidisphaeraceae bacterium]|nr:MogA/MoaB family molybdenum cofactor biosynthesis protein [Tepidisphaeraceae bacterium]